MPLRANPVPGSSTAPSTVEMGALAEATGANGRTGAMNASDASGVVDVARVRQLPVAPGEYDHWAPSALKTSVRPSPSKSPKRSRAS